MKLPSEKTRNRLCLAAITLFVICVALAACDQQAPAQTATQREHQQQELLQQQAVSQVGVPSIVNFREKKLLKDIYELRDQNNFVTYTYTYSEMTGKYVFFCNSIGYGIPYATEFTNPQQLEWRYHDQTVASGVVAQADPNGLYSPASAEGTWVMCKDPNGPDVKPIYIEPRVIVSPFKLP